MVAKGPSSGQDIYDTPPSKDKNTPQTVRQYSRLVVKDVLYSCVVNLKIHYWIKPVGESFIKELNEHKMKVVFFLSSSQVYDFPPSVSKDVPDGQAVREETYDVPPHFAKLKSQVPTGQYLHNNLAEDDNEPPIPEDVYDVPPPILADKHYHRDRTGLSQAPQEIYDIPASLRSAGPLTQDVYDFPREREDRGGDRGDQYVYDIPPQVCWVFKCSFLI